MSVKIVHTDKAPAAIGPYSQGVVANGLLFTAGQIAFADGKLLATSADDRTVKLWDLADFKQRLTLSAQSDWPSALAFALNDKVLAVGRLIAARPSLHPAWLCCAGGTCR